jgi:hypothetical protein
MKLLHNFFVFAQLKNRVSGQCKICHKEYFDNFGSTGNFHKHLKRKHKQQYENWNHSHINDQEMDIEENLDDDIKNYAKINESILTNLIVKCNLPPSLIENSGFRQFMKLVSPKWKPTTARYLTKNLLLSLFTTVRQKIKSLLSDVHHLTITVDVWTDRRGKAFLGVTGHFIDVNYVPQALLLDFVRLKGPHTGENIRNVTEEILGSLEVSTILYH